MFVAQEKILKRMVRRKNALHNAINPNQFHFSNNSQNQTEILTVPVPWFIYFCALVRRSSTKKFTVPCNVWFWSRNPPQLFAFICMCCCRRARTLRLVYCSRRAFRSVCLQFSHWIIYITWSFVNECPSNEFHFFLLFAVIVVNFHWSRFAI